MFIGHFALGFAAKRAAPELGLGAAFAAAQLLDLVWPVLVLAGVERVAVAPGNTAVTPLAFEHYPWSHSLVAALVWAAAFAVLLLARGRGRRAALVGGALVASHFLLDFVSHRPDLPLAPWASPKVGLGLWGSVPGTVVVELGLFGAGVLLYARATRPANGKGRWGLAGLLAFLLAIHAANLFGPPPPVGAPPALIAGPALAMWLLVAWGAWVDRNRRA